MLTQLFESLGRSPVYSPIHRPSESVSTDAVHENPACGKLKLWLAPFLLWFSLLPHIACAEWQEGFSLPGGNGMNHFVTTLIFDSRGDLYAGGAFTNAGRMPANRIAKWDGSTERVLESGIAQLFGSIPDSSQRPVAAAIRQLEKAVDKHVQ